MVNKLDAENKLFRYFGLDKNKCSRIRQISLETKIPYMTLNRIIKKFERQNLVITKKIGKSIVCSLNKNNSITKQHLTLASEAYKSYFLERSPLIKKMYKIIKENEAKEFSAILFGSYAKGKEQKHSDVDIAFISNFKQEAKNIQSEFKAIEQIYDIEINVMIFTEKQFSDMLKTKGENVGKQILKNHVVLHNPELFWNIVYGVLT